MNKIVDWVAIKLFGWYLLYVSDKVLSLKKVNRFEQWIWNRYFAEDFHNYVMRNT